MKKYLILILTLSIVLTLLKAEQYTSENRHFENNRTSKIKKEEKGKFGKQMYAFVIYSTFDSNLNDKIANFTNVFFVDSEITQEEEIKIINSKLIGLSKSVLDKNLKCFDTMKEVHHYIEHFRDGLKFRRTDKSTFDSIANYTTERNFLRNYYNLE